MLFTCGQLLKLVSFHHVYHDVRNLVRVVSKLGPSAMNNSDENIYNMPKEDYEEALKYPRNLELKRFLRYLMAPTCCYQLTFPTTDRIRWSFLAKRVFEFLLSNLMMTYLFY